MNISGKLKYLLSLFISIFPLFNQSLARTLNKNPGAGRRPGSALALNFYILFLLHFLIIKILIKLPAALIGGSTAGSGE